MESVQVGSRSREVDEMAYDRKRTAKEAFLAYIKEKALPELKKGNETCFDCLQMVFLCSEEKGLQMETASVYAALLEGLTAKKLIRLSEDFRKYFYSEWDVRCQDLDVDWEQVAIVRDRFSHLNDIQYGAMLKMGTFTGNGYYRQKCMEALDGVEGGLPFFILRLNDWVWQIRDSAFFLVSKRLQECGIEEIFAALPMLEKVKASGRRKDEFLRDIERLTKVCMCQKFSCISKDVLESIHKFDINVKNAIYRFANLNKVLEREQMECLLALEKTGYGKMLLISGIFRQHGYEQERLRCYLSSSSAIVRYHALLYRYEVEKNVWPELERMLLDKSKKVREYAGFLLVKHRGMDLLKYYLERLWEQASKEVLAGIGEHGLEQLSKEVLEEIGEHGLEQVSKEVLWGIGEYGSEKEIRVIMPFLKSKKETIVSTALATYGKLARESGREVYWSFLFCGHPLVVKRAYGLIRKYEIHYGAVQIYESLLNNRGSVLRGYLLNLLLYEPSWDRLPYLLLLYLDDEMAEESQNLILSGIGCRYVYGKISAKHGQWIREILEHDRGKIPEQVKKGILFDLKYVVQNP